jgi:hypothetical protein
VFDKNGAVPGAFFGELVNIRHFLSQQSAKSTKKSTIKASGSK